MRRSARRAWSTASLLLLHFALSSAVHAHVEERLGGFVSGLGHPASGLDHLLGMILVGLWGAQLGPPALWVLPVAFPIMMACGGFLGLVGVPVPQVEVGIAMSVVTLGLMVAREARPPLWIAGPLITVFAICHGHAHGTEVPPGQSGLAYSIGFVVATGGLHALGIAMGCVRRWPVGRLAIRATGAAIVVIGLGFLRGAVA